jgi:hypothetical protein
MANPPLMLFAEDYPEAGARRQVQATDGAIVDTHEGKGLHS